MKRIQYYRYGGPEELRLEEVERPAPAKGEVLVRVVAAAANPMDWAFRRGDAKLVHRIEVPARARPRLRRRRRGRGRRRGRVPRR